MNRVAFGELYIWSRNHATDQLTKNPAAERSRGSFVSASNGKGLRVPELSACMRRERLAKGCERRLFVPGVHRVEDSLTLCPKTAFQLTTLLPSHPPSQRFHESAPRRSAIAKND